jgi:hypothetical protein
MVRDTAVVSSVTRPCGSLSAIRLRIRAW